MNKFSPNKKEKQKKNEKALLATIVGGFFPSLKVKTDR
jgi:hypothetical protein